VDTLPPTTFWWQVIFEDGHFRPDFGDRLCRAGSSGVMENDGRMIAYFDPVRFSDEPTLRRVLQPFSSTRYIIEKLPVSDWGREWKKHFKPLRVSRRLVVRPSWEKCEPKRGDKVIVIDPKMAFGTGTHETTQLVLEIIDECLPRGARVLDVGTGSGILAIAAVKLGARSVVAVDVEAESMDNAGENIRRNRVTSKIRCVHGTLAMLKKSDRRPYDWILANIQRSVIVELLEEFHSLLKWRGTLVVSGILTEEDPMMCRAFEDRRFTVDACRTKGEWMAYQLRKKR
jgi:ribosomal protein L11 methyltransferase